MDMRLSVLLRLLVAILLGFLTLGLLMGLISIPITLLYWLLKVTWPWGAVALSLLALGPIHKRINQHRENEDGLEPF